MMLRLGWVLTAAGAAVVLSTGLARAQEPTGTVAGRVTDPAGRPIANVQVSVIGTRRGALTDEAGTYRITGVPPGTHRVAAQRLGFGAGTLPITVAATGTTTLDFTLSPVATKLDEVVVTATGETQRVREAGNTVARIDTSALNQATVTNLSQVLQARASGVTVLQSAGQVGASSRIRIRGSNSVSLTNDPLIIMDGVRINNSTASSSIGVGGQVPSRFNDINPEEIENIEIIKGPAAAALYGTAAANGVIQITTKKGRAGRTRWDAFVEGGTLEDVNTYPANYLMFGTRPNGALTVNCNIDQRARNLCRPDSLVVNNPLQSVSPFQTGSRRNAGLAAAGGTERVTYYMAGELEQEEGVYEINHLRRLNLRTNVRGQLTRTLDATMSIGYVDSDLRLPQNDNNLLGTISSGLLGTAWDCGPRRSYPLLCGSDTTSRGYAAGQPPTDIFAINTRQQLQRLTGSLTSNWQALGWLSFNAILGGDVAGRFDHETVPPGRIIIGSLPEGQRSANRAFIATYSALANGTATYDIRPTIRSTTSLGAQLNDELFTRTDAFGARLLAGTNSLSGTNARFNVGETTTRNRTLGAFLREQIAWRDRVFVTGAVRTDRNSAFGQNFKLITYPSISASWVVGEEPFFPRVQAISSLRLRAALGVSGQRPSFRDAITFFTPVAVNVGGTDVPAFTVGGTGNPDLRPERSTEVEGGFDLGLFGDRVSLEYSHFDKRTTDALVAVVLAPSLGLASTRFQNLGRVANWGDEFQLRARVWEAEKFKADVSANLTLLRNKLLELGFDPQGNPLPPIFQGFSSTQRIQTGYPLGAYFQRTYTFQDLNGDGTISRVNCVDPVTGVRQPVVTGGPACELTLGDTSSAAQFRGTPFPTREFNISPSIQVMDWLRVQALIDHRGGHKMYNFTREFRCTSAFQNCQDISDPETTSLEDQARAIARLAGTGAGYVEDASFTKLREVAVTVTVPRRFYERFGASALSVTLAGRNLKTWTKYTGFDPEVNALPTGNFTAADFLTQPQIRHFTARLALTY